MKEVFTLSWDDFNQKCPRVFTELWLDTDLSDVTLATEDEGQLTAHKVILAACSPFFKRLLTKNVNPHPLIYLMGVKMTQLQQLLSYIYLGKCDLTREQLPDFMATGKQLEIEGLHRDLEGIYSQSKTEGISGDFEESKECFSLKGNEIFEMSAKESLESQQDTNQVEQDCEDFQSKDTREGPGKNPKLNETVLSSEIVAFKHSSKAIKCKQCDYQTSNGAHLRQHQQNVHEGMKYSCTNCDYKSGDKSSLKRHIEVKHSGVSYTCEVCHYRTVWRTTFKNHVRVHHNGQTFDCRLCKYKANSKLSLQRHTEKEHEGLRYECFECDGIFTEKQALKVHVRSVHKGVKIECDICGLKLSSTTKVRKHKQTMHYKAKVYGAKTLTEATFTLMTE